jgi:glycosyltransferase involved in cell wall biosynthesis
MSSRISWLLKYPPRAASSRVRGLDVARELARRGAGGPIAHPGEHLWKARYLAFGLGAGSLVFQKRSSPNDQKLARWRRALGRLSIFDLDDAPAGVEGRPEEEARVRAMMGVVSGVAIGSVELERYAHRHARAVCLVPSTIDTRRFAPSARRAESAATTNGAVTIGWIGNGLGYARDLTRYARILRDVIAGEGARFLLVGAMRVPEIHGAFAGPGVEIIDEIEWTDDEAVRAVLDRFDVGIYPLEDTSYNRFKCGFKAVQYMAMGIPVIASPVGENRIVVEEGRTGLLPSTEAEWTAALRELVRDAARRRELGDRGRARVETSYSLEVAADRLLSFIATLRAGKRAE